MLAIGNPYGLGGTVTAGIISALHRGITGAGAYDRYIQTDASINMGNSGGPMFDLNGNVIGINSALISPTGASVGIGLAIPAELAKPVIDSLRRGQRPSRGYLGVGLQPLDENIAESLGLPKDRGEIVRSVQPNEPAATRRHPAGRRHPPRQRPRRESRPDGVLSSSPTRRSVREMPVELIRGGRRQTVNVTVGQRPTEEELARQLGTGNEPATPETTPATPGSAVLGLQLQPLSPQISRALSLPADRSRRRHHAGRSEQRREPKRASSAAT